MNTKQAVEFVGYCYGGSEYDEEELEIVHIATVMAIGSKIEGVIQPGMNLFEAMAAFMNLPSSEARMLRAAVQNAVIPVAA